jgi:peptidoglycan hydrolase-like protein with peptidoglycan-binding domain
MKDFFIRILAVAALLAIGSASASAQVANSLQLAQAKSTDAQSLEKLDMSAVPELDGATVRRLQSALRAKGFDPGPANGKAGEKTKAAVQEFQNRFGIDGDGAINNQTLFALGVVGIRPAGTDKAKKEAEPDKAKKEAARPKPKQSPAPKRQRSRSRPPPKASQQKRAQPSGGGSRTVWCAQLATGGRNCGYKSFQNCRAAISGIGGICMQQ